MKTLKINSLLCLLTIICCVTANDLSAQKAKFKSDICSVQKAKLPTHYSAADQRGYDVAVRGRYGEGIDPHAKKVYGWTIDGDNPNVKAIVNIYGYSINTPQKHSEKKQKKDKDGKVIKTWTEYWYTNSAVGRGKMSVYGINEPFEYTSKTTEKKKNKKVNKWVEKLEAKAEEQRKDLADNPFLNREVIAEAEATDSRIDDSPVDVNLDLVDVFPLDKVLEVKTGRHKSPTAAYNDYLKNQKDRLVAYHDAFAEDIYKTAVYNLNALYGFTPVNNRFYLKKMKGDSHPDLKQWNDACQATETIFKTFLYNKSIEEYQQQFDPIIEYFDAQVKAIPEGDKKRNKQKKAAFRNLQNILYYLDRQDAVIALSNEYLDSKKLDRIAKRMLKKAERQKAHLTFHKMSSCHINSDEVVDADDIETGELLSEDDAGQ